MDADCQHKGEARMPDPLLLLVEDDAALARKLEEGRERAYGVQGSVPALA